MYTIYTNNIIEEKINVDMDLAVECILKSAKDVTAIVLTGGFGRGEGSVLVDGEKCQPINDYDFTIIAERWRADVDLNSKRIELATLFGIRQVDLSLITKKSLHALKLTMANYDLIHASKVIYGDDNWSSNLNKWNCQDMPIKEGIYPLFLFLSSILQAFPQNDQMSKEDLFWSYQQLTKTILGWSTAMLVFDGLYDPSYHKRNLIFQNEYSENKALCDLVQKATEFKLQPNINPCHQDELKIFWRSAKDAHLNVMKDLLSKFYNTEFSNWENLLWRLKMSPANIAKKLLSNLLARHHYQNCLNTDLAKLYMCLSLDSDDTVFLNKSRGYYKKLKLKEKLEAPSKDYQKFLRQLIMADINARIFFEQGSTIFYE